MLPQKSNKNVPFFSILILIILAAACLQGYLLISKKVRPEAVVRKTSAKASPVAKARKPSELERGLVPPPIVTIPGRIAIVIDDWGYNRTHCKFLSELPIPAGVAILPHLPYSLDVVQCAVESGKEPMLHLPLEPHNMREAYEQDYLLTTEMSPSVVKKQLVKILNEMPGIIGVNNHTGSKGTEDDVLVTLILAEIKRRGLFFVDSFTSERSVCGEVAKKLRMRIARRDVFLDNRNERSAIEHEFANAARIAKNRGHVLVIGHDRALTLQIIKEQVKKLQTQGYEFISIKDYIKQYEYPGN